MTFKSAIGHEMKFTLKYPRRMGIIFERHTKFLEKEGKGKGSFLNLMKEGTATEKNPTVFSLEIVKTIGCLRRALQTESLDRNCRKTVIDWSYLLL